jgi:hypothetical protein
VFGRVELHPDQRPLVLAEQLLDALERDGMTFQVSPEK